MNRMKEKIIEEYWLKKLTGDLPKVSLPLITTRKEKDAGAREVKQVQHHLEEIPITVSARLIKAARNSDIALFILVLSGLNIALTRYTGIDDLVLGTIPPAAHENDNQVIFCRSQIPGGITVKEFITRTKEDVLKAINHSGYHPDDLVEMLRVRNNTDAVDIFNAAFIYEPFQKKNQNLDRFELVVILSLHNGRLQLQIKYPGPPGSHEIIKGFGQNLITTLEYILDNPTQEIGLLSILSPAEKNRLLYDFNRTEAVYPKDKTLHQLFEEQAKKTPGYTALVGAHQEIEGTRGLTPLPVPISITYRELNEQSHRLALKLKEKGVKPGTIAAIMVNRTLHLMVGLLGILKAGAAYLPLDPEYPEARIKYILEKSNASVLVTQKNLFNRYKNKDMAYTGEMIDILHERLYREIPGEKIDDQEQHFSSKAPAYVIYTSGSTGNPKGVMVPHRNAVNFITGMISVIDFLPGKSILALTTISFDIFFLETLLPLTRGLKVVIAGEDQQKDPALLEQLLLNNQVNMVQFTPSRLQLLLNLRGNLQGLAWVEELMVGGEAFPSSLLEKVKEHFPGKIYNMYGPTETTIWSMVKELTHTPPGEITIGTPIANTRLYIVDRNNHLQPLGVTGELLIAGAGVALGYLNNVEFTADKFCLRRSSGTLFEGTRGHAPLLLEVLKGTGKDYNSHPPITPSPHYPIYRTGDLARWLPTGEIEFLGREDHQVKIRGFRIELEEIEEQLMGFEGIKEAVVTAKTGKDGESYLTAYFVPAAPGKEIEVSQLREYLSQKLPQYMIPSYFISLEKIPLTPNGKINRPALPVPDQSRPQLSTTYTAPKTDEEKIIAQLWKDVLDVDKVGIYDNFFDLGGNSMKLVRLSNKLKETLEKDIPVITIFRYPTIESLLQYLGQENTVRGMTDRQIDETVGDLEETMGLLEGTDGE